MCRHVELLEKIILGNSRKECRERKGRARFPSSLSERPSRPLGSRRNYAIVTSGAGVCFRSKCIAKCTPGEARVYPSKCTRNGDARCCISFFCEKDECPLRWREEERERTLVISLLSTKGWECAWIRTRATKQRDRRRKQGNPSHRWNNLNHDLAFGICLKICLILFTRL